MEIITAIGPLLSPGLVAILSVIMWLAKDRLNTFQQAQNERFTHLEDELRQVKIRLSKMMKLHSTKYPTEAPSLWVDEEEKRQ